MVNSSVLEVDHIVIICAGQEPYTAMFDALKQFWKIRASDWVVQKEAGELDAKRAIGQGAELAAKN